MPGRMTQIRQLLSTYAQITERIRYGVPFYDYKGMMIYMGPFRKKRLMIGFCNGVHMQDEYGLLKNDAGQTQIRHFELFAHAEPDLVVVATYIEEALRINDLLFATRK